MMVDLDELPARTIGAKAIRFLTLRALARQDRAAHLSYRQSADKRDVPRSSMRNHYRALEEES